MLWCSGCSHVWDTLVHIWVLTRVLAAPPLTQLPVDALGKPGDGSKCWAPGAHMRDLDGAPGSSLTER